MTKVREPKCICGGAGIDDADTYLLHCQRYRREREIKKKWRKLWTYALRTLFVGKHLKMETTRDKRSCLLNLF